MLQGAATLRFVCYDIQEMLQQTYDDAKIELTQIAFWVLVHADKLRKLHKAKISSGAYLAHFESVPVLVDPDTGRNYIVLPDNIYDFDKDAGIEVITYKSRIDRSAPMFASVSFTRVDIGGIARLYYREEEKPSPDNPYMYRIGDRIYFLGTEFIDITEAEVVLHTSFNPTAAIDLDAPFDFPQDLIPILKMEVLKMGVFVLQMPSDTINDGSANQKKVAASQSAPTEMASNRQYQYDQDNT